MKIMIGDIVELKRSYPCVKGMNVRGVVTKITYSDYGYEIYHITIPRKYMHNVGRPWENVILADRHDIRKIK